MDEKQQLLTFLILCLFIGALAMGYTVGSYNG
jgi:hypothetical protein